MLNILRFISPIQPRIGPTMPSHFASTYTPIAEAGTPSQIRHVARLLAAQMTNAGVGPGVEQVGYVPTRVNFHYFL